MLYFKSSPGLFAMCWALASFPNGQVAMADEQRPTTFKVALVQMLVEGGRPDRNLQRAEARIRVAAAQKTDMVLLPETMDLGWTHPSSLTKAEPIPSGKRYSRLAAAAKKHGVYVCAGLTERDDNKTYNAAVLIDPQGELPIKHRKINELDIGHEYYARGDRLSVVETTHGTIGVMICADATAKDRLVSRSLCYMGAEVILSPSAWAMPADHDNDAAPYGDTWRKAYRPVCEEFTAWIVSASNVGPMTGRPWQGQNCIGCSLAIDAQGTEILQGPYGADADTILYVDIAPKARTKTASIRTGAD